MQRGAEGADGGVSLAPGQDGRVERAGGRVGQGDDADGIGKRQKELRNEGDGVALAHEVDVEEGVGGLELDARGKPVAAALLLGEAADGKVGRVDGEGDAVEILDAEGGPGPRGGG